MSGGPVRGLRPLLARWRERVAATSAGDDGPGWERSVRRLYVLAHGEERALRHDPRRRHWRRYLERQADEH